MRNPNVDMSSNVQLTDDGQAPCKPSLKRLEQMLSPREMEDDLTRNAALAEIEGEESRERSRNPTLGRLERMMGGAPPPAIKSPKTDDAPRIQRGDDNVPHIEKKRNPTLGRLASMMRQGGLAPLGAQRHMETLGFQQSPSPLRKARPTTAEQSAEELERSRLAKQIGTVAYEAPSDDDVMAMMRSSNKGRNNF